MIESIKKLEIDETLRLDLIKSLEKFNSFRVGNTVDLNVGEEVNDIKIADKVKKPIQHNEKPKRKLSFLERLFITEYAT